jgi:hypothetical protein
MYAGKVFFQFRFIIRSRAQIETTAKMFVYNIVEDLLPSIPFTLNA